MFISISRQFIVNDDVGAIPALDRRARPGGLQDAGEIDLKFVASECERPRWRGVVPRVTREYPVDRTLGSRTDRRDLESPEYDAAREQRADGHTSETRLVVVGNPAATVGRDLQIKSDDWQRALPPVRRRQSISPHHPLFTDATDWGVHRDSSEVESIRCNFLSSVARRREISDGRSWKSGCW
jgi:hypothetical protein